VAVETTNLQDIGALGPVVVLILGGCALLLSEVFLSSRNRDFQAGLSAAFASAAGLWAWSIASDAPRDIFGGFGRADAFGAFATMIVCFALALTSITAQSFLREQAAERGEFHALAQFGAAGMILMAIATDLITIFVALEVMSLATYALTSYLRSTPRPSEAGLKYFILGSFSSAVFLYGAALAYGAAGSTRIADIASAVTRGQTPGLVAAAMALIAAGFLFKIAAVPFHMWAPDVYEGAPTPVTGFMAAGVKVAAFASVLRVFFVAFGDRDLAMGIDGGRGWVSAVSALAVATMVVGNLLAIAQRSVKRMLAYSSISHAGYLLVGVAVGADPALRGAATQATLFYLAAYTATAIGAFGVVAALEQRAVPGSDDDARYDGLAQRHPMLALAMAVFMLSLAGIPPTVGFMGKLFLFRAAVDGGHIGLVVVGLLSSVAGLYYYLRVLVVMYMRPSVDGERVPARTMGMGVGLAIAAVATVLLGVLPGSLAEFARTASVLGQ
jgi:NADH-quinone oxidoreductase subunit N